MRRKPLEGSDAATRRALIRRVADSSGFSEKLVRSVQEHWDDLAVTSYAEVGEALVPGGYLLVAEAQEPPFEAGDVIVDPALDRPVSWLYAIAIGQALGLDPNVVTSIIDATLQAINNAASSSGYRGWFPGLGRVDPSPSPSRRPVGSVPGETVFGRPRDRWLWVTRPEYLRNPDGSDRADLNPGSRSEQGGWWTCNKATRAGDVALIYESGSREIRYVMQALSNAYPIHSDEDAKTGGWSYGCDYLVLARLAMALHPTVYADLFGRLIAERDVDCWLVNTGWTGGAYPAGERIKIAYSRALVRAAMSGAFKGVSFTPDPVFKFQVPDHCPDVPDDVLQPRGTWHDPLAYDAKARELATLFSANFTEYADNASPEVRTAGPVLP